MIHLELFKAPSGISNAWTLISHNLIYLHSRYGMHLCMEWLDNCSSGLIPYLMIAHGRKPYWILFPALHWYTTCQDAGIGCRWILHFWQTPRPEGKNFRTVGIVGIKTVWTMSAWGCETWMHHGKCVRGKSIYGIPFLFGRGKQQVCTCIHIVYTIYKIGSL